MKLDKTVAFVTGGASGLGEAVVRMVIDAGGRAAIFDLPSSRGAEFASELGDRAAFLAVDVAEPAQVEQAVDAAAEHFGRVDLLVNVAGVSPAGRTLNRAGEMFPLETFRRTVEIN